MARLRDIPRGWGSVVPQNILKRGSFHKTENGAQYIILKIKFDENYETHSINVHQAEHGVEAMHK